jgi:hypothetical protein
VGEGHPVYKLCPRVHDVGIVKRPVSSSCSGTRKTKVCACDCVKVMKFLITNTFDNTIYNRATEGEIGV